MNLLYSADKVSEHVILITLLVILKCRTDATQTQNIGFSRQHNIPERNCNLKEYVLYQKHYVISLEKQQRKDSNIYSSVWCHEDKLSKMRCHFINLCYVPKENNFLFLLHQSSIISGVNNIKEISENLFLSSVNNHNAFKMKLVTGYSIEIINNLIWMKSNILLFTKFKPDNVYHVFHDDLLPLYFTKAELNGFVDRKHDSNITGHSSEISLALVNNSNKHEYDFLYYFLFKEIINLTDLNQDFVYCFNSSYVGLNKMSVWYDYGFGKRSKPIMNDNFNREHIELFKNAFIKYFGINRMSELNYNLILSRKRSRKLLNEVELLKMVQQTSDKSNMSAVGKIVSIENDGVLNIIRYMICSTVLIGVHGAVMVLALFMPRGSSVIEIWPYSLDINSAPIYSTLCKIMGIHYIPWLNKDFINTKIHPQLSPLHFFNKRYYNSSEIYEHLANSMQAITCCDDPDWLLRLNQDTYINIYDNRTYKSIPLERVLLVALNYKTADRLDIVKNMPQYSILGPVQNALCTIQDINNLFELTIIWQKPWNLPIVICPIVTYEVVVDIGTENSYRYLTSDLYFYKRFPPFLYNSIQVWITSICENVSGQMVYLFCPD